LGFGFRFFVSDVISGIVLGLLGPLHLALGLNHQIRATQMADRGPNPNLWMATTGPCQLLKGVFYIQKFLSQNFSLLAVLLKHFTPRQLCDCRSSCCSAKLQCTPELGKLRFLVESNCFLI